MKPLSALPTIDGFACYREYSCVAIDMKLLSSLEPLPARPCSIDRGFAPWPPWLPSMFAMGLEPCLLELSRFWRSPPRADPNGLLALLVFGGEALYCCCEPCESGEASFQSSNGFHLALTHNNHHTKRTVKTFILLKFQFLHKI
ncbi:unnamed protein product [Moneuplotes crassus]|uniref:Uncharacterized protein n=1 Tax=Euplotes crassus TaxID=5936 RepID=A0AAD2D7N3_EUPCR|nr:unnamed protein product [Moneuplotes crassus]